MGNGRSPKTAETEAITSQPFMAHNDLCYYSASVKLATRIDLWGEISLYAHPFLLTRFRNSILTTLDENHAFFKTPLLTADRTMAQALEEIRISKYGKIQMTLPTHTPISRKSLPCLQHCVYQNSVIFLCSLISTRVQVLSKYLCSPFADEDRTCPPHQINHTTLQN